MIGLERGKGRAKSVEGERDDAEARKREFLGLDER
jgi:hypothetical protein